MPHQTLLGSTYSKGSFFSESSDFIIMKLKCFSLHYTLIKFGTAVKPVAHIKCVKVRVGKLFADRFSVHKVLKQVDVPRQKLK